MPSCLRTQGKSQDTPQYGTNTGYPGEGKHTAGEDGAQVTGSNASRWG
ncbi:unnamed protein product [marine sediment metagenome]|uniref:Uncharacterized protein n=1 Tax=marine sediment metagenome TaxID=412755 RepID=X1H8R8_9ZZZZ